MGLEAGKKDKRLQVQINDLLDGSVRVNEKNARAWKWRFCVSLVDMIALYIMTGIVSTQDCIRPCVPNIAPSSPWRRAAGVVCMETINMTPKPTLI